MRSHYLASYCSIFFAEIFLINTNVYVINTNAFAKKKQKNWKNTIRIVLSLVPFGQMLAEQTDNWPDITITNSNPPKNAQAFWIAFVKIYECFEFENNKTKRKHLTPEHTFRPNDQSASQVTGKQVYKSCSFKRMVVLQIIELFTKPKRKQKYLNFFRFKLKSLDTNTHIQ